MFDPPETAAEVAWRAAALEGLTLAEVARVLELPVPEDARRAKGWIGQLLETALGASAGNRPEPDFVRTGVELKTVPVTDGQPRASTFVCSTGIGGGEASWAESRVRHKLARVLWVPFDATGPIGARRIGRPIAWSPSPEEEAILRADWEELTGLLRLGALWEVTARRGRALQLRPKAADGDTTTWALDEEGEWVRARPQGFYLRARFTAAVLARPGRGWLADS